VRTFLRSATLLSDAVTLLSLGCRLTERHPPFLPCARSVISASNGFVPFFCRMVTLRCLTPFWFAIRRLVCCPHVVALPPLTYTFSALPRRVVRVTFITFSFALLTFGFCTTTPYRLPPHALYLFPFRCRSLPSTAATPPLVCLNDFVWRCFLRLTRPAFTSFCPDVTTRSLPRFRYLAGRNVYVRSSSLAT